MLKRDDFSLIGNWWWQIEKHWLYLAIFFSLLSIMVVYTSSVPIANKLKIEETIFLRKHLLFLPIAVFAMLFVSMISTLELKKLFIFVFPILFIALILTLFFTADIKGSQRWLGVFGFSFQPSELLKPFFVIISAWLFSLWREDNNPIYWLINFCLYLIIAVCLFLQPDIGMFFIYTTIWWGMYFLLGMPWRFVLVVIVGAILVAIIAYFSYSHFQNRIDTFLFVDDNDTYQIDQSIRALANGALFGKGFLEGYVKHYLPDSHTDFVFSVIVEEFGVVAGMSIIAVYMVFIWLGISSVYQQTSLFRQLVISGIIIYLSVQVMVNVSSSLSLIPTKGMTLPFISYGGSSLVASFISLGVLINMTKRC